VNNEPNFGFMHRCSGYLFDDSKMHAAPIFKVQCTSTKQYNVVFGHNTH